jgi:hypothetical protein
MTLPWLVRAAATIAFSASGAVHLLRCLAGSPRRPGNGVDLVNDLVHLLMTVEMVAMAWGAPLRDRWSVQLTVFAVATGWFLLQAIAPLPVGSATGAAGAPGLRCRSARAGWPRRAPGVRAACLQHAIIAAVMTWMIAAMSAAHGIAAMSNAGPATARTAGHMAGMAMSTASVAVGGAAPRYTGAWLGGYLLLSASSWLVVAYRAGRRRRAAAPRCGRPAWTTSLVAVEAVSGAISYAVMATGMGAVLLAAQILAAP